MKSLLERFRTLAVCTALLLIPLVFWPWSRDAYRVVKEAGLAIYAFPALAIWLASGRPGIAAVPRFYLGAIAAFMLWVFLRTIGADDSVQALRRAADWVLVFAAAAAVLGLTASGRRRALQFLIAGSAFASLLGLSQSFLGRGFLVPFAVEAESVTFTAERAFSTFGNPIFFAAFLCLTLPVTIVAAAARARTVGYAAAAIPASAAVLQFVALLFASSRGAFLGLAVGTVFVFLRDRGLRRRGLPLAGACLLIAVAIGFMRPALVRHTLTGVGAGRLLMWRTAYTMWKKAPVLGIGTGQFAARYPCVTREIRRPEEVSLGITALNAHSEYFQAAAELGAPGFLLLLVLVAGLFYITPDDAYGRAARIGTLAIAVNSLVNFPFHVAPIQMLVWMIPALVVCAGRSSSIPRLNPGWFLIVLAAVVFVRPLVRSCYVQWGLAYQDAKRYRDADRCFGRALKILPDFAGERAGLYRGRMLFEAGKLKAAEAYIAADQHGFPCHAEGYAHLGVIYGVRAMNGEAGALEKSERLIRRALEFRPAGREAAGDYNSLGNVMVLAGREEDAIGAYRKGLEFKPGFSECAGNLVRLLVSRGEKDEARLVLAGVLRNVPDDVELRQLAASLGMK